MAPVKTSGRATRSTRAATIAKQNTAAASKKVDAPTAKKTTTSKTSRTTSAARRTRTKNDEPESDPEDELQLEEPPEEKTALRTGRNTKTTAKPTTIPVAPAPRRRVKVTPLDAPELASEPTPVQTEKPKRTKNAGSSAAKKTSSKVNKAVKDAVDVDEEQEKRANVLLGDADEVPKTRSKRTKQNLTTNLEKSQPAPKTRGRPKKPTEVAVDVEPEVKSVRTTRTTRAGSVAGSVPPEADQFAAGLPVTKPAKSKATNTLKKKVTFQDIPEDDKENVPLPTKGKKSAVAKKTTNIETSVHSIRAKPLRKPAVTAASTRAQKSSTKSNKKTVEESKERMPRALTPKKITQVARAANNEEESSDSEDELNHVAQTPVRDLSLSPRRPPTSATANALARSMSPAKKLEFGPSFGTNLSAKLNMTETTGALASPARRLPTSPAKDSINESPRRGLGSVGKLLFSPSKNAENNTLGNTIMTSQRLNGVESNVLIQSPKRSGVLDLEKLFPQSAIKSTKKSPFKASLLGSPAKRSALLSPSKKVASSPFKDRENTNRGSARKLGDFPQDLIEELTASSDQRAAASPLRVHRVSDDELQLDFDESVLPVGSPLKMAKPLPKDYSAALPKPKEHPCVSEHATDSDLPSTLEQGTFVEPKLLESQDESSQSDEEQEDDSTEDDARYKPLQQSPMRTSFPKSPVVKRYRDQESVSEDELAADETPDRPLLRRKSFRPSVTGPIARVRQSTGFSSAAEGNQFGFTPLAAQIEGWKASSSLKQQMPARRESANFSPLARQHIDGEIMVSRDNTPVQKLRLSGRNSNGPTYTPGASGLKGKTSMGMRKSIAQRESLLMPFQPESPEQNHLFDEEMRTRAEEREIDELHESVDEPDMADSAENQEFADIMQLDNRESELGSEEEGDTVLVHENDDESVVIGHPEPADFTTDLINYTHASNTAMADFQNLAEEADQLASDGVSAEIQVPSHDEQEFVNSELEPTTVPPSRVSAVVDSPVSLYEHELTQMVLSPSFEVVDTSVVAAQDTTTPLAQKTNLRKFNVNTVVSKVPLRPEGEASPIKLPKKRALSFGASSSANRPSKRVSFGRLPDLKSLNPEVPSAEQQIGETEDEEIFEAERRMMRTSVAPSPGGTSTPATTKSMRSSFNCTSTVTTPGRLSFGVSDFGDSTLDGIELPSDFETDDDVADGLTVELVAGELTQHDNECQSVVSTPLSNTRAASTPTTTRSAHFASSAATPLPDLKTSTIATVKTPGAMRKASAKTPTTVNARGRTPLKPVVSGALNGATVFVDVRTSEGADASGIFVELLTSLGAKCLREWRWNSRASLGAGEAVESPNAGQSVTHVVFKDGSPKTLEKVRHATASNINIFCVGVGWVLDCEKEGKWIDETNYLIDKSVMAKALADSVGGSKSGSRRRKSMEPSMLVADGFGSVKRSASRARRSVSAEMLEGARRDLREIATPKTPSMLSQVLHMENDQEDVENSVPSPSAAFSNDVDAESPSGAATPTGFVSYDPRTAMTPGVMTPYLVSEGKKLVQMSAPPKQQRGLSIFADPNGGDENDEEENEDTRPAKKFKLSKGNLDKEKRRQTLGGGMSFKPAIGSPLGRELR